MCAQARRLLSEFAIDTDGCAEHDGERQPVDDLGQRYPGAEQVEEEIFKHPAEPCRPIATPQHSTPRSSDGSWTGIAATRPEALSVVNRVCGTCESRGWT